MTTEWKRKSGGSQAKSRESGVIACLSVSVPYLLRQIIQLLYLLGTLDVHLSIRLRETLPSCQRITNGSSER